MVFERSHKKFVFIHKGRIMTVIFHCFIPYEDANYQFMQKQKHSSKKDFFQIWLCSTIDFVKTIKQWASKKYHFYNCVWNLEQTLRSFKKVSCVYI
jgi:hypothetical protein